MKTGATGKETRTPMRGIPTRRRCAQALPSLCGPAPQGEAGVWLGAGSRPRTRATAATQLDPAWPQTQPVLRPHRPRQGLCSGCSEARVWVKAQLRSVREGRGLRL